MDKFLVLGPNFNSTNSSYRGIDRIDIPEIPNNPLKEELLSKAIEKYIEKRDLSIKGGEYLHDYNFALEIANSFTLNNDKGEIYEVIQVLNPYENPPLNMKFLGYDIIGVKEYGSLIINFLDIEKIQSIYQFKEYLNDYYLFDEIKIVEKFQISIKLILGIEYLTEIIGVYIQDVDLNLTE